MFLGNFYYPKGQKVLSAEEGLGEVWISGFHFAQNIPELEKNKILAVCSGVDLSFNYPERTKHIKFDIEDC